MQTPFAFKAMNAKLPEKFKGLNCKVAYVPKYVLSCCLKATGEFVILS